MSNLATLQTIVDALGLPTSETPCPDPTTELNFVWLRPDQIVIDQTYQRRVSKSGEKQIREAVKTFSWAKFGVVMVTPIEGDMFSCVDGQHRSVMALLAGADLIPAISVNGTAVQQAQSFVGVNDNRTAVATIDKFRARVAAEDKDAMIVDEILRELEINTDVAPGVPLKPRDTRAIVTLERLVKKVGRGLTFTTLEMLTDAQPETRNILTGFAIDSSAGVVCRVVEAEGDLDRLATILEEIDFEALKLKCNQLVKLQKGKTAAHGAKELLKLYNKGLHKKIEF